MNEQEIFHTIKNALDRAPRNNFTVVMHLQMLKYADELKNITSKEFCDGVGVNQSFGTEFSKMRKLVEQLKKAGLKTDQI